jgi:hypothetical protein
MDWSPSWWALLACAFGAEVIGTMAGFGAATVLTPVAVWFMDIKAAIALVAVFHLIGNASRLVFFGRSIHWKTWALFGVSGVACSGVGAVAAAALPSAAIQAAFGVFLLLYVAASLGMGERLVVPAHPATLLGGGAASGFVAGLLGTGGAIRSACLLAFRLPKEAYLGTSAALALMVDATRLPIYLAERLIPPSMAALVAALVPVGFAGAWSGQRLIRRWSAAAFRRFVLAMLALMGVKMLCDGWRGLAS